MRAAALDRLERRDEARALLRDHLSQRESSGYLHRLLGDILHGAGDLKGAVGIYVRGLSLYPRHPALIEGVTRAAMDAENWSLAREWLRTGLEQPGPLQPLFLERLRQVQRRTGEADNAGETLRALRDNLDPLAHPEYSLSGSGPLFDMSVPGTPLAPPVAESASDEG